MSLEHALAIVGAIVPVASAIASAFNQHIRDAQAKGEAVPSWLVHVVALVNVAALNGDKVVQLVKLVRGGK
jgi:hypothetical protein